MLNKSILLNLNIGKSEFTACMVTAVLCSAVGLLLLHNIFSIFFLVIGLILILVFEIRAIDKVFCTSLFDDEGALYMSLPLASKEIVLGKLFAMTSATFTAIILLISVMALNTGSYEQFLEVFLSTFMQISKDASPMSNVLSMAFVPIYFLISQYYFCVLAMAVLFFFHAKRPRKYKLISWVFIMLINKGLDLLLTKLEELIGFDYFSNIVYLVLAVALTQYCIKSLDRQYNL